MQKVRKILIKSQPIEYFISENIHLYNPKNQRMVEVNHETFEFMKTYKTSTDLVPAIESFLFGKRKKKFSEIRILDLELDFKTISPLISFFQSSSIKLFYIFMFLFFLFTLPTILSNANEVYNQGVNQFNFYDLILIYIFQALIIFFHEMGHYLSYRKRISSPKIRFGMLIRYFFMLMFYTNVNFMRNLRKVDRIWIILSGVIAQTVIGGILSIVFLIGFEHKTLYYLYFINLLIILTNLLPFLKLDGYWLINELIDSKSYMNSFYAFILKKEKIRPIELIFSILNICVILFVILGGVLYIYKIIY